MTLLPKVKLKSVVSFPATILDGAGIDVTRSNGTYQFDLDFADFAPAVGSITDPDHQNALLWNDQTNSYTLVPVTVVSAGSGLPEAPSDGTVYGRQNTTWVATSTGGGTPSTINPLMNGTAAPGVATAYSREDHVHASDTSKANLTYVDSQDAAISAAIIAPIPAFTFKGNNTTGSASPANVDIATLTTKGSPAGTDYLIVSDQSASGSWKKVAISTMPGASGGITDAPNDGLQYGRQSLGWTLIPGGGASPSNASPLMDGVAAAGTAVLYSRGDHVHPVDTSRVSRLGDTMTGPLIGTTASFPNKGNQIGVHGGTAMPASVTQADANLMLYNAGANNWAGFGADSSGQVWLRTGLSGTPAPAFYVDTNQITHFPTSPLAPTPSPGDSSTKLATTAFVQGTVSQVSVKTYGAVGDGVTNDTAAFNAAIAAASAAGGGQVFIPSGTYLISSTLTLPHYVSLVGAGSGQTSITTNVSNLNFVVLNGYYNQVVGIQFHYNVTPTSSGTVLAINANTFSHTITDVYILDCWNGIVWRGTSNAARTSIGFVNNLKIYNFRSIGLYFQYVNDIFITNFLIYQWTIPYTSGNYGIRMEDNCEAINFQCGDVVGGAYSLVMESAAPTTNGARPAFNAFSSVYFDTSINGSLISSSVDTSFVGCWFSCGGLGGVASAASLTINGGDTNMFSGCRFYTGPLYGCVVNAGAKRTVFNNCSFSNNNVLNASGNGAGLIIANSTDGVEVIGGVAKNEAGLGGQAYGIAVGTSVTNLTIYGVDVRNNVSGGISIGTALSASVTVKDCKGFTTETRAIGTVLSGASSTVVAHGLSGVPNYLSCTLIGATAQAPGAGIPRVITSDATNFTYDIGVAATANRLFCWEAKL